MENFFILFEELITYWQDREVIILKYRRRWSNTRSKWITGNEKFENSLSLLSKFRDDPRFANLLGYCNDIDGSHYLMEEFLPYSVRDLEPQGKRNCLKRIDEILGSLHEVENNGLVMVDFKHSQWMVREDGRVALVDVDDIVKAPATYEFSQQVKWTQQWLARKHSMPVDDLKVIFFEIYREVFCMRLFGIMIYFLMDLISVII